MPEVRMSLAEAAAVLGIAPNSVRSRWKAGKIKGERDNADKIWVWVDTEKAANDEGSKKPVSKVSKRDFEGFESREIKALQDHVKTLDEQLAIATAELGDLRPKAADAIRLQAERDGLQALLDVRAEQVEDLRNQLAEAKAEATARAPRGLISRLFSK